MYHLKPCLCESSQNDKICRWSKIKVESGSNFLDVFGLFVFKKLFSLFLYDHSITDAL